MSGFTIITPPVVVMLWTTGVRTEQAGAYGAADPGPNMLKLRGGVNVVAGEAQSTKNQMI